MEPNPLPPVPPRPAPRSYSSQLPVLLGILLALAVLLYLPTYLGRVQYEKTRGELKAVDEVLPTVTPQLEAIGNGFSLIAKKVGPSVVHINTVQTRGREGDELFGGVQQAEGEASGVIVDPAGLIVTNNHVVEGASSITVTLSDGRTFSQDKDEVQVLGHDEGADLAVLKISAGDLIAAEWGDSEKLEVGDLVLAIGNPFGLDRTVTSGIISAKQRRGVGNTPSVEFLQTDAAVNPGNSGGPLVNMAGQIIGINTAIVGPTYQGISFALPSNTVREAYDQLKERRPVVRGYLGVNLAPLSLADAQRLNLKSLHGAWIAGVAPNAPAAKAGIQADDVVTEWNGQAIEDPLMLRVLVARTKPGGTAKVTIIRQGKEMKLEVTVGERPSNAGR